MIEFRDAGGDKGAHVRRAGVPQSGIRLYNSWDERDYLPLGLTPSMARDLAEDLLAFADSAETEEEEG